MSRFETKTLTFNYGPYSGPGYIGGDLPPDPNPDSPDGRTKVMHVVTPMRVLLFDGKTRKLLAETRSKADGTWRFVGLKLNHRFAVEFVNDGQYLNDEDIPYNSFVQDWVYAVPLNESP